MDLKNVKFEKSIYTQGELNEIFENPEMDICAKYSYINNVFLTSLFYMSIFPIGMVFGFGALIFTYISEFFYIGLYKRPEVLNSSLCRFYVSNFKWSIFVFAVGNYIFLAPINTDQRTSWSLINLIVFFVLGLIPYEAIRFKTLDEDEGRVKQETYESNYYFFSTDYEKLNPFTRKQAYTKYFNRLITDKIIDPREGRRIINRIQKTNDISGYLQMRRHADNHSASQEMNNIYMKNKNDPKIRYMFDENAENKEGFSLGGLKNLIMESSDLKEDKMTAEDFERISKMKETLDQFSLTNTGICNALIFLDEKSNINDEYDNYNFNPWKAEWIFTPEYKQKRKDMIHQIRSSMDFRGEISDEEDSIIKYEENKDEINEKIKKMNEEYIKKRSSYDVPINNNDTFVNSEFYSNLKNSSKNNITSSHVEEKIQKIENDEKNKKKENKKYYESKIKKAMKEIGEYNYIMDEEKLNKLKALKLEKEKLKKTKKLNLISNNKEKQNNIDLLKINSLINLEKKINNNNKAYILSKNENLKKSKSVHELINKQNSLEIEINKNNFAIDLIDTRSNNLNKKIKKKKKKIIIKKKKL